MHLVGTHLKVIESWLNGWRGQLIHRMNGLIGNQRTVQMLLTISYTSTDSQQITYTNGVASSPIGNISPCDVYDSRSGYLSTEHDKSIGGEAGLDGGKGSVIVPSLPF